MGYYCMVRDLMIKIKKIFLQEEDLYLILLLWSESSILLLLYDVVWFTSAWFCHYPPWFLALTYYLHIVLLYSTFCWQFRAFYPSTLSTFSTPLFALLYFHIHQPSINHNLSKGLIVACLLACCLCVVCALPLLLLLLSFLFIMNQ